MRIFAGDRVKNLMERMGMPDNEPIEHPWVTKSVENAQKKVEERNFDIRKHLLEYDDVMNQQRKSIYALRKQVLRGQYRTVPSDEDAKKGVEPEIIVTEIDRSRQKRAVPILEQMVKIYSAPPPPEGSTPEEIETLRKAALEVDIDKLKKLNPRPIERDVYMWFGCPVELDEWADDPAGCFEFLKEEVGMSLTEQKERMLDMIDELISAIIEEHCPPNKHYDDWDLESLADDFEEQFEIDAPELRNKFTEAQEIAQKLYADAENVLLKKMKEFQPESFESAFIVALVGSGLFGALSAVAWSPRKVRSGDLQASVRESTQHHR